MGKILYTALKVFLGLLVAAAAVFLVFALVRYEQWPLWVGACILLGPVALVLFVLFVRKHLFRRREKRFVKRIVEQEPDKLALARTTADKERFLTELRRSFAGALEVLRRSRLTRFRNPVYALPWHLVIGDAGSGKSSAVRSARLDAPATTLNQADSLKRDELLQWWFHDRGVILDAGGRLVAPDGDEDSWREFLTLLAKNRRREPLSGLVVAVAADALAGVDPEAASAAAKAVRRRVDELMRVMGARFPVYVLVTKLDRTPGCQGFFERLDDAERLQAMGSLNPLSPESPAERVRAVMGTVAERLKNLRLLLGARSGPGRPGLARFPDAFGLLEDNLALYCRELFQKTPYLETPLFRGLFFGASRRDGAAAPVESGVLAGFSDPREAAPVKDGLFLHDFFATILPGDRRLHSPLPAFLTWRNLTRFTAVASFLAALACVCGLTLFSYLNNDRALTAFSQEFSQTPKLTRNLADDVVMLGRLQASLTLMGEQNAGWGLPRLGYDQSLTAEAKLKELFCDLFQKGVLTEMDWLLREEALSFTENTPADRVQHLASYLLCRIKMVERALRDVPDPTDAEAAREELSMMFFRGAKTDPDFVDRFSTLNESYLAWNTDPSRLTWERDSLTDVLDHVLKISRVELSWLVNWANETPGLAPVTLGQFWGQAAIVKSPGVEVAPAFTLEGRNRIMDFAKRIEKALTSRGDSLGWLPTFKEWYAAEYLAAWGKFAQAFSQGLTWNRTQDEWRTMALRMADPDNPFFLMMRTMAEQLAPFAARRSNPSWVEPVLRFEFMRRQSELPGATKVEENLSKDVTSISNMFKGMGQFLFPSPAADKAQDQALPPQAAPGAATAQPQPSASGRISTETMKAMTSFQDYEKPLGQIRDALLSPGAAVGLVGQAYSADSSQAPPPSQAGAPSQPPGPNKPPFEAAKAAAANLATALGGARDALFTDLLLGPVRFYWGYSVIAAAEGLQRLWEEEVLSKVGYMPQDKLQNALFDAQTGLVWKFVNGPAGPFLNSGEYGFAPTESDGSRFPFTNDFLAFLTKGSKQTQRIQPSYQVQIAALPTDVNDDAQQEPYLTELILDCPEKVQKLENYNYPASQVFTWTTGACADTVLNIHFKSFTAVRTYAGPMGFPKFLQEFQFNVKKFTPDDFPQKADLEILGVKTISVQYVLSGGVPAAALLQAETWQVPQRIVANWNE